MAKYILYKSEFKEDVDKETGEVKRLETKKAFVVKIGSEEKFFMAFKDHIAPIYGLKSADDIKVLLKFNEMAEYETGKVHLSPKRRKEMTASIGMQNSNVSKSIKRLKDIGMISGEDGEYQINPVVFWVGNRSKRLELLKSRGLQVTFNFMLEEDE